MAATKYWMVNTRGFVCQADKGSNKAKARKEFGDYFPTRKMAEEAKKRMVKLFKRLKAK